MDAELPRLRLHMGDSRSRIILGLNLKQEVLQGASRSFNDTGAHLVRQHRPWKGIQNNAASIKDKKAGSAAGTTADEILIA